jgi:hypothetical protein
MVRDREAEQEYIMGALGMLDEELIQPQLE